MNQQELIVLVGPPASGKSTWSIDYCKKNDVIRLSSDELRAKFGTGEDDQTVSAIAFKVLKETCKKLILQGNNVLIDATNMHKKARKDFVDMGKEHNVKLTAVVFEASKELLMERNKNRGLTGGRNVPEFVIDRMINNYQVPTYDEFDDIKFIPQK